MAERFFEKEMAMRSLRLLLASSLVLATTWPLGVAAWTDVTVGPSDAQQYGAQPDNQGGLHFALHAPEAEQVNLLLFDSAQARAPSQIVPMQKQAGDWQIRITGPEARPGLLYMYQARGPRA